MSRSVLQQDERHAMSNYNIGLCRCDRRHVCRTYSYLAAVAFASVSAVSTCRGGPYTAANPLSKAEGPDVISVTLYKDNTTWSDDAKLSYPPSHLFTADIIAGIEVRGPASQSVQASIWSSDDEGNVETIPLTETAYGSGVYRNSGTGSWPHFWTSHNASQMRLKTYNEDGELVVVPIIAGTEHTSHKKSGRVDLAEVAVVDGTSTLDAAAVYGDLTGCSHPWCGIGIYDLNNNPASGTGAKCVELGQLADLLNVSGHSHNPTVGISGEAGFGLSLDNFDPSDIGSAWNAGELEWCILAACSQVAVTEDSPSTSDFGIQWIRKMPKVHALMGYREVAPTAGTDVNVAHAFCTNLASQDVPMAWMLANRPNASTCPGFCVNATALVNINNLSDRMYTLTKFPTTDKPSNLYRYYWIDKSGSWLTGYTYKIVSTIVTLP